MWLAMLLLVEQRGMFEDFTAGPTKIFCSCFLFLNITANSKSCHFNHEKQAVCFQSSEMKYDC